MTFKSTLKLATVKGSEGTVHTIAMYDRSLAFWLCEPANCWVWHLTAEGLLYKGKWHGITTIEALQWATELMSKLETIHDPRHNLSRVEPMSVGGLTK